MGRSLGVLLGREQRAARVVRGARGLRVAHGVGGAACAR